MHSALYYPHTYFKSEALLKTALLLWDEIRYIVPWENFEPRNDDALFNEAFELVAKAHVPTEPEKKQAHEFIEDFASRSLQQIRFTTRVTATNMTMRFIRKS